MALRLLGWCRSWHFLLLDLLLRPLNTVIHEIEVIMIALKDLIIGLFLISLAIRFLILVQILEMDIILIQVQPIVKRGIERD